MQVDVVAELENWGRWVRGGHGGISQCESIEGNYRRRRVPGETDYGWGDYLTEPPPADPPPPIDVLQALAVERTMRFLPRPHRIALKLKYVRKLSPDRICGRLAIPYDMWEVFLLHAQLLVKNRLTRENSGNTLAIHADLPHLPRLTRDLEPSGSGCNGKEEVHA
jgi:hypothetical protein